MRAVYYFYRGWHPLNYKYCPECDLLKSISELNKSVNDKPSVLSIILGAVERLFQDDVENCGLHLKVALDRVSELEENSE